MLLLVVSLPTAFPLPNQLGRVVLPPLVFRVLAKVPAEGLLTPRRIDGIGDWGQGRDGFVEVWVFEILVNERRFRKFTS